LSKLGLDRLDDLPALGDFVPGPDVFEALEVGLRVSDDEITVEVPVEPVTVEPVTVEPVTVELAIDLSEPPSSIDLTSEPAYAEPLDALEILADDDSSHLEGDSNRT